MKGSVLGGYYVVGDYGVSKCAHCGYREEWETTHILTGEHAKTGPRLLKSGMIETGWTFGAEKTCYCPACSANRDLSKAGYVEIVSE